MSRSISQWRSFGSRLHLERDRFVYREIIRSQQAEIAQMKVILSRLK
jgi:hypothetical protein